MRKNISRFLAIVLALAGFFVLIYTVYPIISFELENGTQMSSEYLSPVPEESYATSEVDYTDPENWFESGDSSLSFASESEVKYYNLSIPKLDIENATVAIGGEDLEDSLIQWPGTALPGDRGNAVIFGHSILPQFYNPKDYLAIFSTLPTMRKGDQIEVSFDGILYRYKVEDVFEVLPTDLEILAQNNSSSYLTLVTCTPPGHPLRPKRLIVRAKLDPYGALSQR